MLIRCPSRRSAAVICTAADRWNGPLGKRIPVSPLMASDHHLIDIHLFMPDDHASMRKGGAEYGGIRQTLAFVSNTLYQ